MNEQNNMITGVSYEKMLVNFPFLTKESLTSLADALGLKMNLSELHFCHNFFKHERLPDPTVGDLVMIDRVTEDLNKRPDLPLIASFMTNDKTVADTYADLMSRRRAVNPDYKAPCSIVELLDILPSYAGNESENADIRLFAGKERFANAASKHYSVCVSGGDSPAEAAIGIKEKRPYIAPPEQGDAVYAVLKSFNGISDFERRLNSLIDSSDVAFAAKQIDFLDEEHIVTLLSERLSGISLNAAPYENKFGERTPFAGLYEKDSGAVITASKDKAADMLIAAQELGLRVILLGTVNNSMKISAVSSLGHKLSLDIKLLRSLKFAIPVSCESDSAQLESSAYASCRFPVINGKRYRICSAEQTGGNAFTSGFNSVIYAYSLGLLSGSDTAFYVGAYTVSSDLRNPKSLGSSLELILGAYRAQCELGIYDANPTLIFGNVSSLRFHALAEAKKVIPSKIVGKNSYVYYLEPLYREDCLPDTEDMKKMHSYILKLINDGIIISACPTGDDLIATLDKMSEDTCVEYIRHDKPVSHFGGFIVETTQRIQGSLIGRSLCKEEAPDPSDD